MSLKTIRSFVVFASVILTIVMIFTTAFEKARSCIMTCAPRRANSFLFILICPNMGK